MSALMSPKPDLEVITALVRAGANANAEAVDSLTALMRAAEPEIIATLVKAGVNVNAKNSKGWTPLMWAVRSGGKLETVTALIQAILTNKKEVITALLAAGADIEAAVGKTAPDLILTVLENPVLMQVAARAPSKLKSDLIKGGGRADIVETIMPIIMASPRYMRLVRKSTLTRKSSRQQENHRRQPWKS